MLLGADAPPVEVNPNPDPLISLPVHQIALVIYGVHLLENLGGPLSRGICQLVGAGFNPPFYRRGRSRDIPWIIHPPRRIMRDVSANASQHLLGANDVIGRQSP